MPSERGWMAIGLFLLTFFIFGLIALQPDLAKNQLFSVLATAVVTAGLIGGAVAFYYSTTKSSADKDVTIAKQLDKTS